MSSDELKPCPFCGAKAEVLQDNVCTWGLIEHKPDCWLAYDEPRHKQEIPQAEFDAWNKRAKHVVGELAVKIHPRIDWDKTADEFEKAAAKLREAITHEEDE